MKEYFEDAGFKIEFMGIGNGLVTDRNARAMSILPMLRTFQYGVRYEVHTCMPDIRTLKANSF